jgi:plasmid maintenance system antidote protein VapI
MYNPPHPGEVLKDELEARGLSAHALSTPAAA